jgi:2-succinyl-6-hydroxy-2,4-cyclohexadiene-1-carboxylate synthase
MTSLGAVRAGAGPLVIVLHGFTQTASSVKPLAGLLAASRTVLALDLPGHGTSSEVSADLDETAGLVIDAARGEPFDLVGYSLGGRVALHVACRAPAGLGRTVAISASPGIEDPSARARRLERDAAMAEALDADGDVAAFIVRWLENPLFATLPPALADVDARRTNTSRGLAESLRRCSLGAQRWLVPELGAVPAPLLMVAGARDDQFLALACTVAARSPSVTAAAVPGSGHVCHLEQPAITARLIDSFLAR